MESSSPVLHLAVLDYHTLLQHSSSSLFSQQDAVPSRNSGRCGSKNGVLERPFSELGDGIADDSLKSEVAKGRERDLLVAEVMTALGPCGSGLLAVRGVPEVSALRRRLLPLAKKLALMGDAARRPVLKNYGLSTDVPLKRPGRPVSAFATKLQYTRHSHATDGSCLSVPSSQSSPGCLCDVFNSKDLSRESRNFVSGHSDLEQLGSIIRQLGACMVEVGLLIARLCDSAISGAHLEDAIWESGSVKSRLIHYHASTEKNLMLYSAKMGNGFTNKRTSQKLSKFDKDRDFESTAEASSQTFQAGNSCTVAESVNTISEELWQEWHYDYGILTVLTAPMFLSSPSLGSTDRTPECESCPGGHSGLGILARGVCNSVSVSPDCLIVQVGEAAQIASGGKLAAVAHCVCRPPTGHIDISRETFVTFLQPAWGRVLNPPMGLTRAEVFNLEGFQNSCTTSVEPKEGKGEVLEESKAELVYPRPLCTTEGGDCDGTVVAEVRNLELVDKYTDRSQPKEGKGYTEGKMADMSNGQIQGISSVKLGTKAPVSAEENLSSQNGSERANNLSEQYTKVSSVIPSLDSRWKEGFTFAEFSRETTAQYYGAQGRQSQRTDYPSAG